MSLADSFKKHGATAVVYNPHVIIGVAQKVMDMLKRRGERPVTMLAVAGLLVMMQSAVADDSIDNTIELMRTFIDRFRVDPRMQRRPQA